jgi:hypothetical protein
VASTKDFLSAKQRLGETSLPPPPLMGLAED